MATILIDETLIRGALSLTEPTRASAPLSSGALQAGPTNARLVWIEKIWNEAQDAILLACRDGQDAARVAIEKVNGMVAEARKELKSRADDVGTEIVRRLQETLNGIVMIAIGQIPATVIAGEVKLQLTELTIANTIKAAGSVAVSLSKVCEFAAEGSLVLTTKYAVGQQKPMADIS